jgi:hypothetical protein
VPDEAFDAVVVGLGFGECSAWKPGSFTSHDRRSYGSSSTIFATAGCRYGKRRWIGLKTKTSVFPSSTRPPTMRDQAKRESHSCQRATSSWTPHIRSTGMASVV